MLLGLDLLLVKYCENQFLQQHEISHNVIKDRVTTGYGKVWEIRGQGKSPGILEKVREIQNFEKKSGKFAIGQENFKVLEDILFM